MRGDKRQLFPKQKSHASMAFSMHLCPIRFINDDYRLNRFAAIGVCSCLINISLIYQSGTDLSYSIQSVAES